MAQLRVILPDSCKHGLASTWYIKGGTFLDQLDDYRLLKAISEPRSWWVKSPHFSPSTFAIINMQLCIIFLCSCSQPKDGLTQLKHVAEWILKNKCCVKRLMIGTVHVATFNLSNQVNTFDTQYSFLHVLALPGMTKHVTKETISNVCTFQSMTVWLDRLKFINVAYIQ